MLGVVIRYFAKPDQVDYKTACMCAGGVVGASFLTTTCHHPASLMAFRLATKLRVTWCTLMYKKVCLIYVYKSLDFKQYNITWLILINEFNYSLMLKHLSVEHCFSKTVIEIVYLYGISLESDD